MTRGIADFQPKRLQQALETRSLTQGQLASLVGVSPATVSKWRSGDQSPESHKLERLATTLNLESDWFTRPLPAQVSKPLYRSNAQALKTARSKLEGRIEWAQELAYMFGQFADFPVVRIPERSFVDPENISDDDIEVAAEECRLLWQLGRAPIQDLVLAAESAGIIVVREETEIPAIEGLSCWSSLLQRPLVLLSADKANAFRSRFDLAHEIGHLILHKHILRANERDRYSLMEKQAHRFAGALLLPAQTFADEIRMPVSLDNLLILKQKWGVSVAAIMMRLHALELIDDEEKLNLFKRRSSRWGAKSEPGDDKRPPEMPRLLKRTVDLLVNAGVMPSETIPRFVGLSAGDVEQLAGLGEGYFSGPAEIVQLATLRSPKAEPDVRSTHATDGPSNVVHFPNPTRSN